MGEPPPRTPSQRQCAAELREALRPRTVAEQRVFARLNRLADVIVCSHRLWHATNEERFGGILASGAILPEPPIPDAGRWRTADGPNGYPLVRSLGGVSLFDFGTFPGWDAYGRDYPLSSLRTFVPVRDGWAASIWIEIDRARAGANLLAADELRERGRSELRRAPMPLVEVAHLGRLPVSAFRRCYRVTRSDGSLLRVP